MQRSPVPVVEEVAGVDHAALLRAVEELEAFYSWDEGAEDRVRSVLASPALASAGAPTRARVDLMVSIGLIGRGTPDDAAALVRRVRDWALAHGDHRVQVRAEVCFSDLFRRIGDPARSLEHAVTASRITPLDTDAAVRCELALTLADALDETGDLPGARVRYEEAAALARPLPSPRLAWRVLNNWAYAELVAGGLEVAAALVVELEALATAHGATLPLMAVDTAAGVLHAQGRSARAASLLRSALVSRSPRTPLDTVGEALLTLTTVERERGDLGRARATLEEAATIATVHQLDGLRVAVMEERAALLAADGDHAGAYALYRTFHAETLEVLALKRDARARTLHAMLEVDEARRDTARYREMSYRDPLTGLLNRRFVDEDLDARLRAATTDGPAEPLSVALVDLDHFKRVNDTFSHEVGDEVLTALAGVLQRHAGAVPGAWAARLGGEEFLVVMPGTPLDEGAEVAERLRADLAGQGWRPPRCEVVVTASIGVAAAGTGAATRAALLREADRRLYEAKAGGRDRVVASP